MGQIIGLTILGTISIIVGIKFANSNDGIETAFAFSVGWLCILIIKFLVKGVI